MQESLGKNPSQMPDRTSKYMHGKMSSRMSQQKYAIIYIYIYIYIYTVFILYIYIDKQIYLNIYIYIYINNFIYIYTYINIHTYTYTYIYSSNRHNRNYVKIVFQGWYHLKHVIQRVASCCIEDQTFKIESDLSCHSCLPCFGASKRMHESTHDCNCCKHMTTHMPMQLSP